MRYDRKYQLQLGDVVVRPPIRVTFNIDKSNTGSLNKGVFEVYNLRSQTRERLTYDPTDIGKEVDRNIDLVFVGGYGDEGNLFIGTVFRGSITRNDSDFVNSLEVIDGGRDFATASISQTVKTKEEAISALSAAMPNTQIVDEGGIADMANPVSLVGNPYKASGSILKGGATRYFQDNKLIFSPKGGVEQRRGDVVPIVSARTGLLGVPERDNFRVTFETLLNPQIRPDGYIVIETKFYKRINGLYRVQAINYSGDYEGDVWRQTINAFKV